MTFTKLQRTAATRPGFKAFCPCHEPSEAIRSRSRASTDTQQPRCTREYTVDDDTDVAMQSCLHVLKDWILACEGARDRKEHMHPGLFPRGVVVPNRTDGERDALLSELAPRIAARRATAG